MRALMVKGILILVVVSVWFGAGYMTGAQHVRAEYIASELKLRNKQGELTRIVKDRDVALAAAQLEAATKRNSVTIEKEVIYRDKIKTVTVYQCVRDSGLLDLYDAVHGVK
ncbi:MAG: hypothetical protein ACRCYD_03985 [Plesiomonas sp.]